jgi:D-sedoheptulose 7-phosphate isomerase
MLRKLNIKTYFTDYRKRIDSLLDSVNVEELEKVVALMINTFKKGKTVYVCGNGGSAATASHMQADFSFFIK